MIRIMVLASCCLFLLACNDTGSVIVPDNTVSVRFDLQEGFEDHSVSISIDSILYFRAILSPAVPFAGAIATFNTFLTRDQHHLKVLWYKGGPPLNSGSINFTVGQAAQYFIGLKIQFDTLVVDIQDHPFGYI